MSGETVKDAFHNFIDIIKVKFMKRLLVISFMTTALFSSLQLSAQDDKSKRPSPPAVATQKLKSGATVTINYSQPSIKGRTIGVDLEPMAGKVWRTGANEAT